MILRRLTSLEKVFRPLKITVHVMLQMEEDAGPDVIHNRSRKKGENATAPGDYICPTCDRSSVSRIGLFSHTRSCKGFDLVIPLQKHQHIISIHSSSNDLHMKQHHAELTSPTEESFHHALATIQKQNEKVVSLFGTSPERPSESGSTLLLTSSVSYDQHNDQQPLLFEPKSGHCSKIF
ncbi:uncharacterized protein LOC129924149 isoform X1 [Biomphalaria glabrata]|uniref:Uncharacterized protein LOC129924149 isoform X1 n=1 Tax=Biomphalaria glabrata TaxID=6526 RepID=A0A9W2ZG83_BIOGL|nr:uncharacterized protein LOC129924149 isoform X1 [Biomphalaria glabrata]